jgi:hypothetical protein
MLEAHPPNRRNPVLTKSFSVRLLWFFQMKKKKSLSASTLPLSTPVVKGPLMNYMKEDSKNIATQRNTAYDDSQKVRPDPRFWSYFHADWYRYVYQRKQTPFVLMQWTDWAFMEKNKDLSSLQGCH